MRIRKLTFFRKTSIFGPAQPILGKKPWRCWAKSSKWLAGPEEPSGFPPSILKGSGTIYWTVADSYQGKWDKKKQIEVAIKTQVINAGYLLRMPALQRPKSDEGFALSKGKICKVTACSMTPLVNSKVTRTYNYSPRLFCSVLQMAMGVGQSTWAFWSQFWRRDVTFIGPSFCWQYLVSGESARTVNNILGALATFLDQVGGLKLSASNTKILTQRQPLSTSATLARLELEALDPTKSYKSLGCFFYQWPIRAMDSRTISSSQWSMVNGQPCMPK